MPQIIKRTSVKEELIHIPQQYDMFRVDVIDNVRISLRWINTFNSQEILVNLTARESDKLKTCLGNKE